MLFRSHPGPNLVSGAGGGDGLNGIGPAGNMTWTSVAKVIMLIDMPTDKTTWFGGLGNAVWGASFAGMHTQSSNALHFDGHAKSYSTNALHPAGTSDNDSHWKCANCSNSPYAPASQIGQLWMFWGTSFADSSHQ